MKLYIDTDASPTTSLRVGYLTRGQKTLDPVFFGDVLNLDVHLCNGLGELLADREDYSVSFLITDGTTSLIALQTLTYNGLSFNAVVDCRTSEMQSFLDDVETKNAVVEMQAIRSGTTRTIFQGQVELRNRFSEFTEISLSNPLEPIQVSVLEVLAPNQPILVTADTTPESPALVSLDVIPLAPTAIEVSRLIVNAPLPPISVTATEIAGLVPSNPTNIQVSSLTPLSPSNVQALSTPLAPTSVSVGRLANQPTSLVVSTSPVSPSTTIFSDTLLPWQWNATTEYVPQAFVFEGTEDFADLNDKKFVWDGTTLENGAPVYECTGANCQTHTTGGTERIYASSVTSTTIAWNLFYKVPAGFRTSGIGYTQPNLSFHLMDVVGALGTLKFLPTNISIPDAPSSVDANIIPLEPIATTASVVSYSQDLFFDTKDWDGYGKLVVLLQPITMAGDNWGQVYPTGTILRTIGVHTYGYPVRVEDPDFPRLTPYSTGINQRTGAWTWLNEYDQGIKWQFVDLTEFPVDNHRRAVEEAVVQVSGISDVTQVNGGYIQTSTLLAIQRRDLGFIYDASEQGSYGNYRGYTYKKVLNSDCTITSETIYMYKAYTLDSNGNPYSTDAEAVRWSFAETHPQFLNTLHPAHYDIESEANILKTIATTGLGYGYDNPFSQSWATELTSGSNCEPRPLRPVSVAVQTT
jgi:hypothetical protein